MTVRRWYVGLSSGQSLAGVDAALVRVEGIGTELVPRLEHFAQLPYPRDLRSLLLRAGAGEGGPRALGVLHRALGETFAAAARLVLDQAKCDPTRVFAVACPGHAFWHDTEGRYPASLALGMASAVAERTGLTVFADPRGRDLVAGGQGYPLTALIDQRLFHAPDEHRVLLHLGGMATILSLPAEPGPALRHVVGFHAAPCTLLLDGLMRLLTGGRETFDPGGRHAVQGCCVEPLLQRWLDHPVLRRRPPRHLPAHEFGPDFLARAATQVKELNGSLHDLLCTATHFVARAVVRALNDFLPEPPARVLLSGGAVRNGFLWRLLEQQLAPVPVERTDAHGIPAEARKALAFAALAALTMDGVPANLPAATGAAGPRLLGQFTPGSTGNWARCLAWMAAQTAPLRRAVA